MRPLTAMTTFAKLLLAATACSIASAAAAADYFIKLGPMTGEQSDSKVREAAARLLTGQPIPIQSYSWGVSQGTCCQGGGSGTGKSVEIGTGADKVHIKDINAKYTAPINVTKGSKPAAADYNGDGRTDRASAPRDVAIGQSSGKRQDTPLDIGGSVTVGGNFPTCTVGVAYDYVLLHGADGQHRLNAVTITSCGVASSSGGGQPTDSLTLSYLNRKLN